MRDRVHLLRVVVVLAALLASTLPASTSAGAARLDYTLTISRPGADRVDVSIRVEGATEQAVDLAMPAWLPGVYRIQKYHGAVRDLAAVDDAGSPLAVSTPSAGVWRIASAGAPFTVRYQLDVSGRQKLFSRSQLDKRTGVIAAGATLLYLPAHRDAPVSLALSLPDGWRAATPLEGDPGRYTATDYDELVDSPILVGDFGRLDFELRGIRFTIASDRRLDFDLTELATMSAKLANAQLDMFGTAPFAKYVILFMVTDDPGGTGDETGFVGLEHDESTLITIHPKLAANKKLASRYLAEVVSHEIFHAWNVRAIRPVQLDRADYLAPVRIRSLWLLEGATSYYAKRFVASALFSTDEGKTWFFDEMARSLAALESRKSLEEMSVEVPDGNLSSFVEIYPRGEATALLLDLRLRADSGGRVSLDDVLRRLYELRSYREEDLPAIVADVSGRDYSDFFRRYIAGREKPPVDEILALAGWETGTRVLGPGRFVRTIREKSRATADQQALGRSILVTRPAAAAAAGSR